MCRGYQKHGWVHARGAGTQVKRQLTRRLRRGKVNLTSYLLLCVLLTPYSPSVATWQVAVLHYSRRLSSASFRKSSGRGGGSVGGEEAVVKPASVEIEVVDGGTVAEELGELSSEHGADAPEGRSLEVTSRSAGSVTVI